MIVALEKNMLDKLVGTLADVIGNEVKVEGYAVGEVFSPKQMPNMVLASGHFILDKARSLFPDAYVIPADRVINGNNLDALMMLPQNTSVLVVNYFKDTAEGTIVELQNLGVTHLTYESYWPEKDIDTDRFDVAISPGMIHLCPQGIENKINIGDRGLSLNTFCKILLRFQLDTKYLDRFQDISSKQYFETSKKIKRLLETSERLRRKQNAIISDMNHGILVVNEKSEIVIANPYIKKILGARGEHATNVILKDILLGFDNELSTTKSQTIVFDLDGREFYCTKNLIRSGMENICFYTFKERDKQQELKNCKKIKLENKGNFAKYTFNDLLGKNIKLHQVKEKAKRFAATEQTIFITGESGTGKEIMAQAIHNASLRAEKPFVAVNFAAMPDNLVESLLFGYVEGAFTGALKGGKIGMFELAQGGTIFLDEIGDAPLNIQARLLRVLQEKEIVRLGGNNVLPIDVRIISATNKSLLDCIKNGTFREDLFYRLNVLLITMLPLREMKEEIPYFLKDYFRKNYKMEKDFDGSVIDMLMRYGWTGNIRELKNVAEYMIHSSLDRRTILMEDVPEYILAYSGASTATTKDSQLAMTELEELAELGDVDVFKFIITTLLNNKNSFLGRNTLLSMMLAQGIEITEGGVKKHLRILQEMELIQSGKTKQGSKLTHKGRLVYDKFSGMNI